MAIVNSYVKLPEGKIEVLKWTKLLSLSMCPLSFFCPGQGHGWPCGFRRLLALSTRSEFLQGKLWWPHVVTSLKSWSVLGKLSQYSLFFSLVNCYISCPDFIMRSDLFLVVPCDTIILQIGNHVLVLISCHKWTYVLRLLRLSIKRMQAI